MLLVHYRVHAALWYYFHFLHLFHCVCHVACFLYYFVDFSEPAFPDAKIKNKGRKWYFVIWFISFIIFSSGLNYVDSICSGSFPNFRLELFANTDLIESVKIYMSTFILINYIKFPKRIFFSFSFEWFIPKLLFLACLFSESTFF